MELAKVENYSVDHQLLVNYSVKSDNGLTQDSVLDLINQ
jgi:hypothetical protein